VSQFAVRSLQKDIGTEIGTDDSGHIVQTSRKMCIAGGLADRCQPPLKKSA
jgi:hypothetical protein